jgi:phosphoribosylanthranilate isomerase
VQATSAPHPVAAKAASALRRPVIIWHKREIETGSEMAVDVKICGLKSAEMLDAALEAEADYVGLVFFGRSPRNVTLEAAADLADRARGRAQIVALIVDADDSAIDAIVKQIRPDWLQLHGDESPARVAAIKGRSATRLIKAIKVATPADAATALAFSGVAELILFDAKPPAALADALPGGNGVSFDWQTLAGVKDQVRYMLSGGLDPANVAAAIRATGATAVDVSSGVESAPGVKDANLIRHFIRSAKTDLK